MHEMLAQANDMKQKLIPAESTSDSPPGQREFEKLNPSLMTSANVSTIPSFSSVTSSTEESKLSASKETQQQRKWKMLQQEKEKKKQFKIAKEQSKAREKGEKREKGKKSKKYLPPPQPMSHFRDSSRGNDEKGTEKESVEKEEKPAAKKSKESCEIQ
jgi:hypothetical protein